MQVTCYLDCEFFHKSYKEIQTSRKVYSFLKYNTMLIEMKFWYEILEIYFLIQYITRINILLLFVVFAIVDSLVTPLESPKYVLSNSDVFYFCCLLIIYSHETGFNFQLLNCCVCVLLLNHLYPVICVSVFFFYSLFIITSTCRKNHFSVWEVKEYLVCNEVIITWPLLHAVPSCHFRYYYHHHFF